VGVMERSRFSVLRCGLFSLSAVAFVRVRLSCGFAGFTFSSSGVVGSSEFRIP
jgi:hypothetical protein